MPFQFKYYKNPGVIIDVIKLLSFKLNPKYFLPSASLLSKQNPKEVEHLKKQLNSFETPPKELLLFFYKPTENFCNYMTRYAEKILCHDFPHTTLSSLYEKIEKTPTFKQEVISFYLPKCETTGTNIVSLLRTNNTLPDNIKFYLLSFQLDPQSFCSLLCTWIGKYAKVIEQKFLPLCNEFCPDDQTMQKLIHHTYPERSNSFAVQPILYSICSVIQDFQYIDSSVHQNWLITGCRFRDVVNVLTQEKQTIDLQEICEALGDSIRFKIINHLCIQNQSTRQQMIDSLILPATSYHHHIEKLKKAGLIVSHRQNNNHIYSLNYSVFNEIANIFKTYSKGGDTL